MVREMNPGDEIIVTELDHHANVDTWKSLEQDRGVVMKTIPLNVNSGQLELQELENLLTDRTRLLAIGAASNVLGTISDIGTAVKTAKQAGALTFVDAVHYAAHEPIDVDAIGCDFLACSAYKFYGPHIGILYSRRSLIEKLDFPKLRPAPNYGPERAETGTNNHEGIAGAAAAINFLASLAAEGSRRARLANVYAEFHNRQSELTARLWEGLAAIPNVTLYGPAPGSPRTATVSFTVNRVTSTEVATALAERAVFASNGDFYALTTIERLSAAAGLVRAGGACYTTSDEVERLLEGVRSVAC